MSIKRVIIIVGDESVGKTRMIRILAKALRVHGYQYTDLLQTPAGQKLNALASHTIENDDIFGVLSGEFNRIGILSAGDGKKEVLDCLNEFDNHSIDTVVCAARVSNNEDIKGDINDYYDAKSTEKPMLRYIPIPYVRERNDIEKDYQYVAMRKAQVTNFLEEVLLAINGF